jgi:hypothetical protein
MNVSYSKSISQLPFMIKEKEYVEKLFHTMKCFNVLCMKEDINSFTVCRKYLITYADYQALTDFFRFSKRG